MTNKTVAVLITDCGIYDTHILPAYHHVILGTFDEAGLFTVKGSTLIANGCTSLEQDSDNGFNPEHDFFLDDSTYLVMNSDVQYSNLKLLDDSIYLESDMAGTEVQGFAFDAVLGGPAGWAVTGAQLHSTQPKFDDDAALYLWEENSVEVLPVTTHTTH